MTRNCNNIKLSKKGVNKMKRKMLILTVAVLAVLVVGASTALANGNVNGYDTIKQLTGMTDDEIVAQRADGARLGEIAEEKGVRDAFRETMEVYKLETIKQRLADGTLTQEEADAIIASLEDCDGTSEAKHIFGGGMMFGNGNNGEGKSLHSTDKAAGTTSFRGIGRGRG
jgi:hypothetical protein